MSAEEAKNWVEKLRHIAHQAAENAELARERMNHAMADGDEVLAEFLKQQVAVAERAAQDVHVACDQLERQLQERW